MARKPRPGDSKRGIVRDLGETLPEDERKKLHARLMFLFREASAQQRWQVVGALHGICTQIALLEAATKAQGGYVIPARHRVSRRKPAPGQLPLFNTTNQPAQIGRKP